MHGTTTRLLVASTFVVSLLAVAPAATAHPSQPQGRTYPTSAKPVTIGTAVAYVRSGTGQPVAVRPTALPR